MAVSTSDEIKAQKNKLYEAESLKKQSETLNTWIGQMSNLSAKVNTISIQGPESTFLIMDEANYGVAALSKDFVIASLSAKKAELDAKVQTLLTEVDTAI